jgi:hypothetical protein
VLNLDGKRCQSLLPITRNPNLGARDWPYLAVRYFRIKPLILYPGEFMKKPIAIIAALLFASTGAFAEEHAAEALKHAEHALSHGKAGHAPQLVDHAENALKHAQKAESAASGEAKAHVSAGIKALEESIAHGKQDHAEVAAQHAEEAVSHLKAGNHS